MKKINKINKKSPQSKDENSARIRVLKEDLQNKMDETRKEIRNLRVEFENKKSKKLIQKVRDRLISS